MKIRLLLILAAAFVANGIFAQKNTETRPLQTFEKISVAGGFDQVTLQEGSEEKIVLEVSGTELDKVITEVKGKTLDIRMKKGNYHNVKIRLTITYRKIDEISTSGSTDIVAATTIKGESLTINTSGSGSFKGALDVRKFEVNISGSSDISVSGQADKQAYAISGSGDVNAGGLKGQSADVAISGSGDVELNVSGPVKTAISGSGSVDNKG